MYLQGSLVASLPALPSHHPGDGGGERSGSDSATAVQTGKMRIKSLKRISDRSPQRHQKGVALKRSGILHFYQLLWTARRHSPHSPFPQVTPPPFPPTTTAHANKTCENGRYRFPQERLFEDDSPHVQAQKRHSSKWRKQTYENRFPFSELTGEENLGAWGLKRAASVMIALELYGNYRKRAACLARASHFTCTPRFAKCPPDFHDMAYLVLRTGLGFCSRQRKSGHAQTM